LKPEFQQLVITHTKKELARFIDLDTGDLREGVLG